MRSRLLLRLLAVSLVAFSCREMIVDPWVAELPEGAVQVLPDMARYNEFEAATRNLPLRNDMAAREQFVVRDQSTWETFWTLTRSPRAVPFIDFDSEMVIVVALGKVVAPWERVVIAGVMASGAQLYVLVYRDGTNPECTPNTLGYEPSPIALALVPSRPGTPRFLERLQPLPAC